MRYKSPPDDFWIISQYRLKPYPSRELARVECDRIRAEMKTKSPQKGAVVYHCKKKQKARNSALKIAKLRRAVNAFMVRFNAKDFPDEKALNAFILGYEALAILAADPEEIETEEDNVPVQAQQT